jgi:hypothetical protein
MKEQISYYKGMNPLVSLPAFAAGMAHIVLVIMLFDHKAPNGSGFWQAILFVLWLLFCLYFLLILPVLGIVFVAKNDLPTLAYASKRWVRGMVSFAIATGIGTFLALTAALKSPNLKSVVDSLLLASSAFSVVLLLAHISISLLVDSASKLKPERTSPTSGFSRSPMLGLYGSLVLYLRQHQNLGAEIGEASFALLTLSSIALLWFEDPKTSISDRETIPLCIASLLWMVSAVIANYAYASLASVTFVLPYLVYFLPLILLGIYYYVSAPEEA